jgi:hypothetical protein
MIEREQEEYRRSHLPLWLKSTGCLLFVGLLCGPGLWDALLSFDMLALVLWALVGYVAAKVSWLLC